MKKIVALIIVFLMCLSLCACRDKMSEPDEETLGYFESTEVTEHACEHEWTDADCVTAKFCSKCDETEGEALGHNWNAATRKSPKTCSRCGETEGNCLSLKEAYPEGKLRFANGRFLMNADDLLDLYVQELEKNGFYFKRMDSYEKRSEEYYVYYLQDNDGNTINVAVVTDLNSGLIYMVSAGIPISIDDVENTNTLAHAVYIVFETCHGAMTGEKWGQIDNSMQYSMNEVGLAARSSCDNLGFIAITSTNHIEVVAISDMTHTLMQ